MKIKIFFVIFLLLMFNSCHSVKKEAPKNYKTNKIPKEERRNLPKNKDDSIILKISGNNYYNSEFNTYIKFRYKTFLKDIKKSVLKSLYNSFVDYSVLLYLAQQKDKKARLVNKNDFSLKDKFINSYLQKEVFNKVKVKDKEIFNYYEENKKKIYTKKRIITLSQILLKDQIRADDIRRKLMTSPGLFDDFVQNESKNNKTQNGRMGSFEKGMLPKAIEEIVFSLKKGQISPVVESRYGYHIFKVIDYKQPGTLTLSEVKEEISRKLYANKIKDSQLDYLRKMKVSLSVETFFDKVKVIATN